MGMEVQVNSLEDMCSLMCDNKLPQHSIKRCIRCGRPLTTPEAIAKGYGKTCERKLKADKKLSLF